MWNCVCDCGNARIVRGKSLIYGISKSCGCLARESVSERAAKHHGVGTRLYPIWDSMRQRCNNPNADAYHNYGGRGISVCEEWDDFSVFRDWALRNGYDEGAPRNTYTLDRIDVNGDYTPENCRWTNMKTQSRNRRNTIYVEYNGSTISLSELADRLGEQYGTLWKRYKRGVPLY